MSAVKLLVIEDDPQMQRLLRYHLTARGFLVAVVGTGKQALARLGREEPALILLDLGLPDVQGMSLFSRIREVTSAPVVVVTAADVPRTRVRALEVGADDYVTKPFHVEELVARIQAVLRRRMKSAVLEGDCIRAGNIEMNLDRKEVAVGGRPVRLTRTEFRLLRIFLENSDRVLSYSFLLEAVWGPLYEDTRSLHVHVCNLRRKLEAEIGSPRLILSVPGVGFRFRQAHREEPEAVQQSA